MNKNIKAYNDIWFNCFINMEITLLKIINENLDCIAFENNYTFDFYEHTTGGNAKFNAITVNQDMPPIKDFADEFEIQNYNREEFIKELKSHLLSNNGFALVSVDLYNWLEGGLCWKKYHWYHYSLVVDYNYEINQFKVFDELNGHYIEFYVDEKKLYNSIPFECELNPKAILLRLRDSFKTPEITLKNIVINAEKIIDGLQRNINKNFWLLPEDDYIAKSFMDLSGVYLQRIEGRQKGNAKLINLINEKYILTELASKHYYQRFIDLANQWNKNRLYLYKLYIDPKSRKKNYEQLNNNIKTCMEKEIEIWGKVVNEIC